MPAMTGVYAAALTPRREGPEIDMAAAFELMDFLTQAGVDGIVLMGSTGEFTHFTLEERSRLTSLVVKRSRVPVLVGVGHSSYVGALELARDAARSGVEGILLMPPYFFRYSQTDIAGFYRQFAADFKKAAPLYIYNVPSFTNDVEAGTCIELLCSGVVAGIKDSTGRWEDFEALNAARREHPFTLMVGQDFLFAHARTEGADGTISGIASAIPELLIALDRALVAREEERIKRLDTRVQEFIGWLRAFPIPVAIRQAALLRDLRVGPHAIPPSPEQARKLDEFDAWFRPWFEDVKKECANA